MTSSLANSGQECNASHVEEAGLLKAEARGFLGKLMQPGHVYEVRALGVKRPGSDVARTEAGFFDSEHLVEAVEAAFEASPFADGVYFTPNPVTPDLLARIGNRMRPAKSGEPATDKDVIRRRFLLIDVDPKRKPGIPATEAEMAEAFRVAEAIRDHLGALGWPEPVIVGTGNGVHMLYPVNLPVNDEGLVLRCLQALQVRFSDDSVEIDTAVANPARATRLPGTWNRKGDGTDDRPHRRARLHSSPDTMAVVPHHLLEALAAEAPARPARINDLAVAGDSISRIARKYLEKLADSIEGQRGSNKLFHAACVLIIDYDLGKDRALPILAAWNASKARPPWNEEELKRKLVEALKKREEAARDDPGRIGRLLRVAQGSGAEDDLDAQDPYSGPKADLPEPRPIRDELLPVPPLPPTIIPAPFRGWLTDIAARIGCPLDYVAVAAIIVVATVVGRKVAIRPKRHDDWTVVPNLWGGVVGRPGELKSPALDEVTRPLRRLAQEARESFERDLADHQARVIRAKVEADAAKGAYTAGLKRKDQASPEELEELAAKMIPTTLDPPTWRRSIVNDSTVEKLLELFAENPNGLLLFRDELTGLLRSFERPGRETDRTFFLEAWNGTGAYTSDRIGRGTIHAEAICLSLLGGIQPGPLGQLLRSVAGGDGQQDDGLVSRLQLMVYPDPTTSWVNVDRYPDADEKARAYSIIERLDELDPATLGAEEDPVLGGPPYLRFAPEAQDLFDTWRAELENEKLRTEHESPLIESHLAKYRSLMPSLALLFHLIEVVDGQATGPVTLRSAEMAAAWCDYLEAHARRIYQASLDGDTEPARRLADRIRKGSVTSPFNAREVAQHGWSGLNSSEEVDRAVAVLGRHDWVKTVELPTRGRPRTLVFINPRLSR